MDVVFALIGRIAVMHQQVAAALAPKAALVSKIALAAAVCPTFTPGIVGPGLVAEVLFFHLVMHIRYRLLANLAQTVALGGITQRGKAVLTLSRCESGK